MSDEVVVPDVLPDDSAPANSQPQESEPVFDDQALLDLVDAPDPQPQVQPSQEEEPAVKPEQIEQKYEEPPKPAADEIKASENAGSRSPSRRSVTEGASPSAHKREKSRSDFLKSKLAAFESNSGDVAKYFSSTARAKPAEPRTKNKVSSMTQTFDNNAFKMAAAEAAAADGAAAEGGALPKRKLTGRISAWESGNNNKGEPPKPVNPLSKSLQKRMEALDLTKVESAGKPPPGGVHGPLSPRSPDDDDESLPRPKPEDDYEVRLLNRPKIPNPRRQKRHDTSELFEKLQPVDDFDNLKNVPSEEIQKSLNRKTTLVPYCCSPRGNFYDLWSSLFQSMFSKNDAETRPLLAERT